MSQLFTEQAQCRATELGVAHQVKLILSDAAGFVPDQKADAAKDCLAHVIAGFLTLPERVASFGQLGCDLVEMVLADQDGWDRYEAAKWLTMRRWLDANPGDEFAQKFEPN